MPDLSFEIVDVEIPAYTVLPMLIFKMRVLNAIEDEQIQNVNLKCQIMLNVTRRRYTPEEKVRLRELFGEPERWGKTLRTFLWTHVSTVVPQFSGSTTVDLTVPCTYDFEVVSAKYFDALQDGEIPLTFLFSGTVFYKNEAGMLQIGQISWSLEANYRLPVAVWREVISTYWPNSAWLRLRKDVFDQLYDYKVTRGLLTWEEALEQLLQASDEEVKS